MKSQFLAAAFAAAALAASAKDVVITICPAYDWTRTVVGTLISVAAALLGVSLVLRRLSNMGDGLSHVAFAAMAIGGVMSLTDNFLPGLAATSVCSVVLMSARSHSKTKGDAALAMLSVGISVTSP